jgi:hypothetical protein
MKKSVNIGLVVSFIFFGFTNLALAAPANSPCNELYKHEGLIDVEVMTLVDGSCVMQVTPNDYKHPAYRSFLFDNRGQLMIFNTIPGQNEAKTTGALTYFFFPRINMPSYEVLADGTMAVTSGSGIVFNFDEKTAKLVSIPTVTFTQDATVSMTNNGGVSITSAPGVWLDTGWMLGNASYADLTRHSTLHSGSATCDLVNSELFSIVNTSPVFRYPTDSEFAAFLAVRCPTLDISRLK